MYEQAANTLRAGDVFMYNGHGPYRATRVKVDGHVSITYTDYNGGTPWVLTVSGLSTLQVLS